MGICFRLRVSRSLRSILWKQSWGRSPFLRSFRGWLEFFLLASSCSNRDSSLSCSSPEQFMKSLHGYNSGTSNNTCQVGNKYLTFSLESWKSNKCRRFVLPKACQNKKTKQFSNIWARCVPLCSFHWCRPQWRWMGWLGYCKPDHLWSTHLFQEDCQDSVLRAKSQNDSADKGK